MPSSLPIIAKKKKKRRAIVLALVVIVLALISLSRTQCERPPKMDEAPFIAQGEVVAEETIKALGNKGQIVILNMDMGGTMATTTKLQLATFLKALKRSHISVIATETFIPAVSEEADHDPMAGGVPGEFFLQVLRKHPEANAIVSFAGAPFLKDEQVGALAKNGLGIVVASNVGISPRGALKKLFEADLVFFAITPRTTAPPSGEPKTTRDVFDQFYQIVTPDKAGEMLGSW